MTQEEKDKIDAWFKEARATYNFIHWEEQFELVETNDNTQTVTLELKKVA